MSIENRNQNQLSNEQLEKIVGGVSCGRHIGKYEAEAHIGEMVYLISDQGSSEWCYGRLESSYEADAGCGTERYHKIYVTYYSKSSFSWYVSGESNIRVLNFSGPGYYCFSGDLCTLYLAEQ